MLISVTNYGQLLNNSVLGSECSTLSAGLLPQNVSSVITGVNHQLAYQVNENDRCTNETPLNLSKVKLEK